MFSFRIVAALRLAVLALAAPVPDGSLTSIAGKSLKVLPLGDSITYGVGSSTSNGYRQDLLFGLQSKGAVIDLVGTVRSGTMADPDNEGHPGWVIEQITSAAQGAFNAGVVPDVVLLHAGTNDCNLGLDVTNANARLDELIGNLTDGWPQATILVAKIIPSSDIAVQENIDTYNAQIQDVVTARLNSGEKVALVDMSRSLDTATDYSDALHPG